jgi:hypothetical protein
MGGHRAGLVTGPPSAEISGPTLCNGGGDDG